MTALLGIDIGGSGCRLAITSNAEGERFEMRSGGVAVTGSGSSAPEVATNLLRRVAEERPDLISSVVGAGIGVTGLASLVPDPAGMLARVDDEFRRLGAQRLPTVAIAVDAVTAHLGALGGSPGVVVALGTGAIAFGGDGRSTWRRVDGWGHLLGDRGGGVWIGLRALDAAIRAHDGVDAAGAALLARAQERYGPVPTWPAQLYRRDDRARIIAAFAEDVAALADEGDETSISILEAAGSEAARSAAAATDPAWGAAVSATGGVFRAQGALSRAFERTLRSIAPGCELRPPAGDPLDGAIVLGERAARGDVFAQEPFIWLSAASRPKSATSWLESP